jgi:predicted helicase
MVARVDTVLREDLNRPDGLADKDVYILDPCCGMGAHLVEVLRTVAATLRDKGEGALLGSKLKAAATERIFGFEILPAPFVVAHLQLGLFLQGEGVPLQEARKERAGVYLTNALTGWEPPKGPKQSFLFKEMEEEHDRAEVVKQRTPILVVLGNPPYNGFAGVAVDEERDLSDAYCWKPGDPDDLKPQGQGLNDLYVRFFRMAERCIVERGLKQGVVCFISNYSWLDGRSFPLMRQRYLSEFDTLWIDCLNGDKYRTGKLTPDGNPDPSEFSTEQNREGIQVGTAIALLVRSAKPASQAELRFREMWGQTKRMDLLQSLRGLSPRLFEKLTPVRSLGLPFHPLGTATEYLNWPVLPDVFPTFFPGVQMKQDALLIDIDKPNLVKRIKDYFDPDISNDELARLYSASMDGTHAYEPVSTRAYLTKRGFLPDYVTPFLFRPFDLRWIYWEPETKLLGRPSPDYFPQVFEGNIWLAAVQQNRKHYDPPQPADRLCCLHIIERSASMFPLLLRETGAKRAFSFETSGKRTHESGKEYYNLSDAALAYLKTRGGNKAASDLFRHVAALLHAPAYARENADALRQDWPRVPLPTERERLSSSAKLGKQIAALLNTETPVPGVTAGTIQAELKLIGAAPVSAVGSSTPARVILT